MGIIRPTLYESFEDCRSFWLDYIEDCRALIKTIKATMRRLPTMDTRLAQEVISEQQELVKEVFAALKEMQRWHRLQNK